MGWNDHRCGRFSRASKTTSGWFSSNLSDSCSDVVVVVVVVVVVFLNEISHVGSMYDTYIYIHQMQVNIPYSLIPDLVTSNIPTAMNWTNPTSAKLHPRSEGGTSRTSGFQVIWHVTFAKHRKPPPGGRDLPGFASHESMQGLWEEVYLSKL